jgi:hypothetical protein
MAHCPAYQGAICSLCCTLDARCGDLCKPHASLATQWSGALRWLLPRRVWPYLDTGVWALFAADAGHHSPAGHGVWHVLPAGTQHIGGHGGRPQSPETALRSGFSKAYMALLLIAGIVAWWLVLAHKSRQVAQEESNRQTHLLMREIESHRQTDKALQEARHVAERAKQQADQANQPRAATSAPSATSCARRSTASWVMRS